MEDPPASDNSSSTFDHELYEDMNEEAQLMIQAVTIENNSADFFNANKMTSQGSVYHNIGVRDSLGSMLPTPWFFPMLFNFTMKEFDEVCALVWPMITLNASSTKLPHVVTSQPVKLSVEQHLMNFILYVNWDNAIT